LFHDPEIFFHRNSAIPVKNSYQWPPGHAALQGPLVKPTETSAAAYQLFSNGDFDLSKKQITFAPNPDSGEYSISVDDLVDMIGLEGDWNIADGTTLVEIGDHFLSPMQLHLHNTPPFFIGMIGGGLLFWKGGERDVFNFQGSVYLKVYHFPGGGFFVWRRAWRWDYTRNTFFLAFWTFWL